MKAELLLPDTVQPGKRFPRTCRVTLAWWQVFHQQKIRAREKYARYIEPGIGKCREPQGFRFEESGRGVRMRFQNKIALRGFKQRKLIDITARKPCPVPDRTGNFPDFRPVQSFSLSSKAGDLRE